MRTRHDISTLESTRYEVAVIRDGKVLEVLGFTPRKSKAGIMALMTKDLSNHFTESEMNADCSYSAKKGFVFGDGSIRVGLTGATEREKAVI